MFLIDYQHLPRAYSVIYQGINKVKRKIRWRQVSVPFNHHSSICLFFLQLPLSFLVDQNWKSLMHQVRWNVCILFLGNHSSHLRQPPRIVTKGILHVRFLSLFLTQQAQFILSCEHDYTCCSDPPSIHAKRQNAGRDCKQMDNWTWNQCSGI